MFLLAYVSNPVKPFSEDDLRALAARAACRNQQLNVTGYLYFQRQTFLQLIEGEEQTVLDLMDVIRRDSRHRVANVLALGEHGERLFPDWSVRFPNPADTRMIRPEDILENALLHMDPAVYGEAQLRSFVLNLTRKMADLRQRRPMLF